MFTQLADLTMPNISPIGIAFDVTRDAVWIVGDFGDNGPIGFVNAMTGAFTSVIAEGGYPGLASPANIFFDRFRTLTVAARNANSGTGGLYRFYVPTGSTFTDQGPVLTGLTSVIDVAPRPEVIGIGAPISGGSFVLNASMSMLVQNPITFSAPRVPQRHLRGRALPPLADLLRSLRAGNPRAVAANRLPRRPRRSAQPRRRRLPRDADGRGVLLPRHSLPDQHVPPDHGLHRQSWTRWATRPPASTSSPRLRPP